MKRVALQGVAHRLCLRRWRKQMGVANITNEGTRMMSYHSVNVMRWQNRNVFTGW